MHPQSFLHQICSLASLSQQWMLYSEWVPSEWVQTADIVMFLSAVWTQILTAPIHSRVQTADIVRFLSAVWTQILTAPIHCSQNSWYCDVFIRLSFWRHPFTAESKQLILWCFYQLFGLKFWRHPFTVESKQLILWCFYQLFGLKFWRHPFTVESKQLMLWCFYQLFGLEFWRHPSTAEHPLLSQRCNATFLQIWWRNNLLRMGTFSANVYFVWTVPLTAIVSPLHSG